jgi:hypothetical protein
MIMVIAVIGVALFVIACAARTSTPTGKAREARYCTKHKIAQPLPGGPEHLVWVLGPHRTKGNKCDGAEHRRARLGGWW